MTNTNTIVNTLCDFIAYVDSFYNAETGIYPIKGMTNSMVIKGVQTYITQIGQAESLEWGGGDSVDRERVRDIILADNGLQWDKSLISLKKKTSKKVKKGVDLLSEHCYNDYRN